MEQWYFSWNVPAVFLGNSTAPSTYVWSYGITTYWKFETSEHWNLHFEQALCKAPIEAAT